VERGRAARRGRGEDVSFVTGTTAPVDPIAEIDAYLEHTAEERLADYEAFLRIPSVSTIRERKADMLRAAQFIVDHLTASGVEHAEVSATAGHPVVYADWLHAEGAPTVLVYGHYDVQPVDPLDLWVRPPFEPRVEDGRIYARGAADDKGQVHAHLWAVRAWLEKRETLPINLRFCFEGEEEDGSEHFDQWLRDNRQRLGADLAVISDTGFFQGNLPAICVGLRGLIYAQIDVTGPRVDLHSGGFGGNVQNPAIALAKIIAGLKNDDGTVNVPGFYDAVRPLTAADREEFARFPVDEPSLIEQTGVPALFGEPGYGIMERTGARPTLDVNGIWGGFEGEGSKTIIPAHAHAKISCRLVADMDPQRTFEQVRNRVMELAPPGVRVEVQDLHSGMWSLISIDHPAMRAAAATIREVFGADPLYPRGGGSIPAAASFASILGLPVVLFGFANPDDNAHAPNESMILANYEGATRAIARYWKALAQAEV
jgi:acetylornithine deacetylase/succinyl-diaminopimelate desuccinylase-like protein